MELNGKNEVEIFLHNIAWLRKQAGLSKKEMAKRLGIGLRSLNKLENGVLPPRLSANVVFHISRQFGISPADQFEKRLGK